MEILRAFGNRSIARPIAVYSISHVPPDSCTPLLDLSVGGLLTRAAEQHPDSVALVADLDRGGRGEWTYLELLADASELARALLARFEPGEHIAIWMPNSAEWVLLELAAGLAGLVIVTVNPAFRAQEAKYVLGQSRSVGVLLAESYRDNPIARHVAGMRAELPHLREVVPVGEGDSFRATAPDRELPDADPPTPAQIQ